MQVNYILFQASGNRVSRQSVLCGSQNIILNGKNVVQSEAIIRGDLANVRIGRNCIISSKAIIRPPFKKFSKGYVKHTNKLVTTFGNLNNYLII